LLTAEGQWHTPTFDSCRPYRRGDVGLVPAPAALILARPQGGRDTPVGMNPSSWTSEDFRHFADQVLCYEVGELWRSFAALGQLTQQDESWNARVESMALHARNLIEFLYHPPTKGRVAASDCGVTLGGKSDFDRLYGQVSAQVSHITVSRLNLTEPKKRYEPADVESLLRRMAAFVQACPAAKRGPELEKLLARIVGEFDRLRGKRPDVP